MKTFVITQEAWYAKMDHTRDLYKDPEIMITERAKGGGCHFEFKIRWVNLGDRRSPRIEMFNDSWMAFGRYPELFRKFKLLQNKDVHMQEMATILKKLGFKDATERERI